MRRYLCGHYYWTRSLLKKVALWYYQGPRKPALAKDTLIMGLVESNNAYYILRSIYLFTFLLTISVDNKQNSQKKTGKSICQPNMYRKHKDCEGLVWSSGAWSLSCRYYAVRFQSSNCSSRPSLLMKVNNHLQCCLVMSCYQQKLH